MMSAQIMRRSSRVGPQTRGCIPRWGTRTKDSRSFPAGAVSSRFYALGIEASEYRHGSEDHESHEHHQQSNEGSIHTVSPSSHYNQAGLKVLRVTTCYPIWTLPNMTTPTCRSRHGGHNTPGPPFFAPQPRHEPISLTPHRPPGFPWRKKRESGSLVGG